MEEQKVCVVCGTALQKSQRKFCSNRCKQALKNEKNRSEVEELRKENARLVRKVTRLTNKVTKLMELRA
jgi:predicted nucleic acid-binding Zn ribbon protein